MDFITTCSELYHDRRQSVSSSSLFLFSLSSFQSSKKIWMYTWVCSSLLSPLAQVRNFPFVFKNFSGFTLCLLYWGTDTQSDTNWIQKNVWMAFYDVPLSGRRLNISAENDCRRLHCSLRDLSSLLQAVGRLAEYFIGEIFAARFTDALAVVERSVLWMYFSVH